MKIAYFTDGLWQSGGTERVLTTKLNWLAEREDIDVTVVTLKEDKAPFFALSPAVRRVMLDVASGNRMAYEAEVVKFLDSANIDVAVAVAGLAVNALPKCKDGSAKVLEFHYTRNYLVNFVRGLHNIRFKQLHLLKMRWLQWKLARTARKYDKFVGLTKRDVGLWGNPANMTYIYNPLSFRSDRKSTCDAHKIIAVGSFTPAKGMDQLVRAFGMIANRYPDWTLDIYGQGQDHAYILSLAESAGISDRVTLHAPDPQIGERLVEASIYAFPSRSDGFGLVITEAMECGLPTVAMDCECGPREIVTSTTGIIVPDKNIEAFADALESLMRDPALRKTMGRNAQAEVERFYVSAIMPQWLDLFRSIV